MKYIPAIDGLRGIAILIVLSSHLLGDGIIPGGLGVTLFFFISGYLITEILMTEYAATGTIAIKTFYVRRFRRLAPALLTMVAIVTAVYWWLGQPVSGPEVSAAVFYYLNYYAIAGGSMPLPFGPLWSLSIEEHYYLIFPVLLLVGLAHRGGLLSGLAALCVAILIWRIILVAGNAPDLRTYTATDTRIDSIAYGAMLALAARRSGDVSPRTAAPFLAAGGTFLLASLVIRNHPFRETLRYSLQGLAMLPLFYAVLFEPRADLLRKILEIPTLVWVGKISYSLYLWHFPVLIFVGGESVVGAAILSFALAAASFYFVEAPFRHRHGMQPILKAA